MTDSRLPFHQRLTGKMLLFGVVPTVALVGLLVGSTILQSYREFRARTLADVANITTIAAGKIDAQNLKMAVFAEMLGRAQTDGGMFGRRADSLTMMRKLAQADPDIQGAYVLYEPNADGNDVAALQTLPKEAMDPKGRFIPYYRRDASRPEGIRLEPTIGMEDPNYLFYLEPKRLAEREGKSEVIFTKPYVYEAVAMIEQVYPLIINGRFVGVSGVDRSLASIDESLSKFARRVKGDLFLATRGAYIAATTDADLNEDQQLKTTAVVDSPLRRLMLTRVDGKDEVKVLLETDPVLGTECYYGVTQIANGDWTLMVRIQTDVLLAELWRTTIWNIVIALLGVTLVGLILTALAHRVGKQMNLLVDAATSVAKGDLSRAIPVSTSRDEAGLLLDAFREMAENLNRIVGQVRHASIQINSTSTELSATSRQQESTIAGLGASTNEVAAATHEIASTGTELLKTMQVVSESAVGAGQMAHDSREGLESMQGSMKQLDEAARSVASRLGAINEKAQGINSIVGTITKVADQTNLLSVNAAIEAERAGEFGVGFLVVAREIRRLADQTASATVDIERMIRQMQTAVASGVMEMDRFGASLHTVQDDVDRVGERLNGIISHVEEDTVRFGQVVEGMRTQATGATQINEAMRTLSVGAQQTLQTASEFGRAASDLQTAITGLKSAVAVIRLRD